jgi:hypothetical protein
MKPIDKNEKEPVKKTFEKPKVTNIEGKEVDLEDKDLDTATGGAANTANVAGELCLGGG